MSFGSFFRIFHDQSLFPCIQFARRALRLTTCSDVLCLILMQVGNRKTIAVKQWVSIPWSALTIHNSSFIMFSTASYCKPNRKPTDWGHGVLMPSKANLWRLATKRMKDFICVKLLGLKLVQFDSFGTLASQDSQWMQLFVVYLRNFMFAFKIIQLCCIKIGVCLSSLVKSHVVFVCHS